MSKLAQAKFFPIQRASMTVIAEQIRSHKEQEKTFEDFFSREIKNADSIGFWTFSWTDEQKLALLRSYLEDIRMRSNLNIETVLIGWNKEYWNNFKSDINNMIDAVDVELMRLKMH